MGERDPQPNPRMVVHPLGLAMLVIVALLLVAVVELWPAVEQQATSGTAAAATTRSAPGPVTVKLLFGAISLRLDREQALIVLVILVSAAGSFVHIATSFSSYVGNKRFYAQWTWWYVLRVAVGTGVAVILYFGVRAGFLTANASGSDVNAFGVAAIAGLSGLFSKQATDKLDEVFNTLFRVPKGAGDDQRQDSLANPVPKLTRIEPVSAPVGSDKLKLAGLGEQFTPRSIVRVNGNDQPTRFVSAAKLTATVSGTLLAQEGHVQVTVFTPPPGGGTSEGQALALIAGGNPAPTLTSLDPPSITAGSDPEPITATGTGFVTSSTVRLNATEAEAECVSDTQLKFTLTAEQLVQAGEIAVTVFSPPPGGGVSDAVTLTVSAAPPAPAQ